MVSIKRTLLATCLIAASGFLGQAPAQTPQPDTLRLSAVVAELRRANPMLQSARYAADAASERVSQAGALPDPMLTLGLRNRPLSGSGTAQMMTMNWLGLAQTLPWPGKLGFNEQRADHLAIASQMDAEEMEAALIARAKSAYFQAAFMDRALGIMAATRDLLRDFLEVTSAKYAVGTGLQQDILQAQVSIARMTADITAVEQNRVGVIARLNAFLGRPATEPIGALELWPTSENVPAVESLMLMAATNRPAIRAARQRALAAEAGYRASRRALYPDFSLAVGYGQRPEFQDLATVQLGITIPLWAGAKQLPERREMRAVQSMEAARELDLHNETFARLSELRAAAIRAQGLSLLYETSILPQALAAVESSLSAYRVGSVDYMTLLSNEMTVNQFEIERVRLAAEFHDALGGIAALTNSQIGAGE